MEFAGDAERERECNVPIRKYGVKKTGMHY
jgi:hypothetical protein